MSTKSIGRIIYVHLVAEELYYSCLLVNEIKGSRSYEDLHTINGVVYATYWEVCFALDILRDDLRWSNALIQVTWWATNGQLRQLFIISLILWGKREKDVIW